MLSPSFRCLLLFPALLFPFMSVRAQNTQNISGTTPQRPPATAVPLLAPPVKPATSGASQPFGLADNMELIYRVLGADGKPAGELRQRVVVLASGEREESKKRTVPEYTAALKSGLYNEKNGLIRLQDLTFRSRRDTCFTDGLADLSPDALRSFRDRKLVYSSTPLAWPNQPTVGSILPAGGVSVQVSSSVVNIATVSTMLRNRRVVSGPNSLTTPAGTFACYKVEASRESATIPRPDMAMRSSAKQVDFYAPGVGVVRTEIYGKKGKIEQVRELTARNSSPQ